MSGNENVSQVGNGCEEIAMTGKAVISEKRASYEAKAQALHEALARKTAMIGRIATLDRAQQAAQAEAAAARLQWSEKLRGSDGVLTREVQKLRVAERSALSLVEEYQVLQKELAPTLAGVELEVARLADDCIRGRSDVVRVVAEDAYSVLIENAGSLMATAMELHRIAETSSVNWNSRASDDEISGAFLAKVGRDLKAREAPTDLIGEAMGISQLDLDGVDMQLVNSPARRSILGRQAKVVSAA